MLKRLRCWSLLYKSSSSLHASRSIIFFVSNYLVLSLLIFAYFLSLALQSTIPLPFYEQCYVFFHWYVCIDINVIVVIHVDVYGICDSLMYKEISSLFASPFLCTRWFFLGSFLCLQYSFLLSFCCFFLAVVAIAVVFL